MNYELAENEIVARATAIIAELGKATFYEVVLMPDSDAEFKKFYANFTKARAAVQYIDSQYDPAKSTDVLVQEETARFRLTMETRKLRGEGGLYNLIDIIKKSLLGFRLSSSDKLSLFKYGLLEFEQNSIQPYLEFECKMVNIQVYDDTEVPIGGNLTSVISNNIFND